MIFEANVDNNLLYYSGDETYVITNDSLELALNEAGSFEFDIPRSNLRFDDFKIRSSMIQVKQNDKEIFYGEVREITDNFDFTRHIYAVGELGFLFDSIQPQKRYQCSPLEMFTELINIHNSQVEPKKRFEVGEVSVSDANDYIYHYTNREDTLTALREKLCEPLNGYLKITKVDGVRYINLVPISRYGVLSSQEIQFGENLMDYVANNSGASIATAIVPTGAMLDDEQRTERAVEGLDEYVTIVGTGVDDYHKKVDDDFLVNDKAIKQFGYIRVTKEWSDVTTPEMLKKKAIEWLEKIQYSELILEVSAFDFNLLDVNIDSYDLGDRVSVWAVPFGMENVVFPIQKKKICMSDLSKNRTTLGNTYTKSYTSQASTAMDGLLDEIPEVSPLLKMAKDNSLAVLLAETTGGHVVYEYNATHSYIEAINVCDSAKIENSLNRWVWNKNGFGFMSRKNTDDKWSDLTVAITMDGRIVADFVAAGAMSGDRIRGGELLIGGKGFAKDGRLVVKNDKDQEIIRMDAGGLTLSNGQKISFADISDTDNLAKKSDIPSDAKITEITENTITTSVIRADQIQSGTLEGMIIRALATPSDPQKGNKNYIDLGGDNCGAMSLGDGLIKIEKTGDKTYRLIIQRLDMAGTDGTLIANNITGLKSVQLGTSGQEGNVMLSKEYGLVWFHGGQYLHPTWG